jgi:pimeloyl-ACP methyl ester carboxylesterase
MIIVTFADGTDVRASDGGRGPAILVLGPGLDDGSAWQKVGERLESRFRAVRLHRRRYRLDLDGPPCTIAQETDDVLAVATAIGEPMLVVGHSSGAVVALEAMAASPSTFAGAVLYEPPCPTSSSPWGEPIERAQAALAAGRPGKALEIFVRDIVRLPAGQARLIGLFVAVHPRMRALVPGQIEDALAIHRLGDRLDAYAMIETPTVLLGGDRSPAHLGDRLDVLARAMPHTVRVVLHGQGHSAHAKAPDDVVDVIEGLAAKVLR